MYNRKINHPSSASSSSPKLEDIADVVRIRPAKNSDRLTPPSVGEMLPQTSSIPRSRVSAFFYTIPWQNHSYKRFTQLGHEPYLNSRDKLLFLILELIDTKRQVWLVQSALNEHRQTWQFTNPARYPSPTIATTDIQEAAVAGLATSWNQKLMQA